jgi:hypothetical protein
MSKRSEVLFDHIADYLRFISKAQSFWFMLNKSYDHGCHLASQFRLDGKDYEVVSPLVAPPWCPLVMPAGCRIASCRPLIALPSSRLVAPAVALPLAVLSLRHPLVNSSRQLVDASPLLVLSLRPAPPSRPLVALAGCCVASRHTALLSSRLLVVPPLVVSSRQLVVAPSSLTALSPSHRAGWLLRCLSLLRPLVVVHHQRHRTFYTVVTLLHSMLHYFTR